MDKEYIINFLKTHKNEMKERFGKTVDLGIEHNIKPMSAWVYKKWDYIYLRKEIRDFILMIF